MIVIAKVMAMRKMMKKKRKKKSPLKKAKKAKKMTKIWKTMMKNSMTKVLRNTLSVPCPQNPNTSNLLTSPFFLMKRCFSLSLVHTLFT